MRLSSASIQGIGRFQDVKINLSGKVVAIVGPNEAGKTSLLRALQHVTSGSALAPRLRSRPVIGAPDSRITVTYEIETSDPLGLERSALRTLPGQFSVSRVNGGVMSMSTDPTPAYVNDHLKAARAMLARAAGAKAAQAVKSAEPPAEGEEPSADYLLRPAFEGLDRLLGALDLEPSSPSAEMQADYSVAAALFEDGRWAIHLARFEMLAAWVAQPDAQEVVNNALWKVAPEFAFFDEEDRNLLPVYSLTDELVARPPRALANVCGLAGLNLAAFFAAIQSGNDAERVRQQIAANETLAPKFKLNWKQSELALHLDVQGSDLKILIHEDSHEVTEFDERSAGLRSFIALAAFIGSGEFSPAPLLLIDEAEQNLHIDAQAELVEMLETQSYAASVIYSTHSPACLPSDLGTHVRVVEPTSKNSPTSTVKNNFWTVDGAGFSPLMMAMGAGAAAFTPARRAVLAEGATEMILLPRLLRASSGRSRLGYQVAPGLSEAPQKIYPTLDLEAARLGFVVDGDAAGRTMREQLLAAGAAVGAVYVAKAPRLELMVSAQSYLEASNVGIARCNPGNALRMGSLGKDSRWERVRDWCAQNSLNPPSKLIVASILAEAESIEVDDRYRADLALMDAHFVDLLAVDLTAL